MRFSTGVAAGLAALSILTSVPARASAGDDAEKVRRLDIMLMVSALRCRTTADGFQNDYDHFSTAHLSELNAAAATLKQSLNARYGSGGANRALDKISTSMANSYGQGHPWLNCAELKQATQSLAQNRAPGALLAAADTLLGDSARVSLTAAY
ncbi:MAG: S-adenosyl-L-homocysteine hydrolase [Candidatus Andeanibacterium colombiense]|uniref:S-adenosyl-L-homocysteine hydrolase n=1 Tax=Candidatus Andeanibacterium colombiense TaxID=3121345 RepID=A0AAJ6BMV9_9SPHN|nr:MAG: S-adenosyl-L-homocysteine hydrolase [Sphingomonadaceae bacterium]